MEASERKPGDILTVQRKGQTKRMMYWKTTDDRGGIVQLVHIPEDYPVGYGNGPPSFAVYSCPADSMNHPSMDSGEINISPDAKPDFYWFDTHKKIYGEIKSLIDKITHSSEDDVALPTFLLQTLGDIRHELP